jgi:WD40 repeat protein
VQLISTETGQLQRTLEVSDFVDRIAYSPTGDLLATSSQDGTARLWDVKTGELLHALEGQPNGVFSVAFSPDGRTLASVSDIDTGTSLLQLLDTGTGQLLGTLEALAFATSIAFSPVGDLLAIGSSDNIARL